MEMTSSTETYETAKVWTSASAFPRVASAIGYPRWAAFEGTSVPTGLRMIPTVAVVDAVPSMQVVTGGVPPRGAPR